MRGGQAAIRLRESLRETHTIPEYQEEHNQALPSVVTREKKRRQRKSHS